MSINHHHHFFVYCRRKPIEHVSSHRHGQMCVDAPGAALDSSQALPGSTRVLCNVNTRKSLPEEHHEELSDAVGNCILPVFVETCSHLLPKASKEFPLPQCRANPAAELHTAIESRPRCICLAGARKVLSGFDRSTRADVMPMSLSPIQICPYHRRRS